MWKVLLGQNGFKSAPVLSLPFQTLEISGRFYSVAKILGYNLTKSNFLIVL